MKKLLSNVASQNENTSAVDQKKMRQITSAETNPANGRFGGPGPGERENDLDPNTQENL